MSDDRKVRAGTRADVPATAAMLSLAFADKPPFTWIEPDPRRRARLLPAMFEALLRYMAPIERGTEIALDDDTIAGAAVWAPPGRWKPPLLPQLRALPHFIGVLGLAGLRDYGKRGKAVEDALHAAHPAEPHWYLAALGTHPAAHRRGIGSALMRSGLARCDGDGLPAYLECLDALVPFYQRFGFVALGPIALPEGASDQVGMWRAPHAGPGQR